MADLLPIEGVDTAVTVSSVVTDTDRISFTVDQVGHPVLVRTSYFPNWSADGAEGPYRVAPNFMVVVPTQNDVELTFGRTGVDWFALLLTAAGAAGVVVLGTRLRPGSQDDASVESTDGGDGEKDVAPDVSGDDDEATNASADPQLTPAP